jgi:hypothetical protein
MPTQVWRPGDYRVCPSCGTRHKVQDLRCSHCNTVLAGAPVRHAAAPQVVVKPVRPGRGLRAVLAVGLVLALAAGLWVRSLFRGAALQDAVEASSTTPVPIPAAEPSFTPPVLSYPPAIGYGSSVPSSMAGLTIEASPLPGVGLPVNSLPPVESGTQVTGMTSIAPPSEPTRQTAFTNDDLEHPRGQPPVAVSAAVSSVPTATGTPLGVIADSVAPVRPAASVSDGDVSKWTSRIRDREDSVRDAQSKVRRLEAEAAVKRARAEALAGDEGARDKAEREVADALEDLEKAERKLSEKQRDLDETKDEARSAGVRFQDQ